MNEVVHFGCGEVHESVHLRLGGRAGVFWERGLVAAEDHTEVLVHVCEEFILVCARGPGGDVGEQRRCAAAVEEVHGDGFAVAVCGGVGPVEPGDEVDFRDCEARVAVDGVRVQYSTALIGAIWIRGPEVRERSECACEGEVDEFGNPGILRAVRGGVGAADGAGGRS